MTVLECSALRVDGGTQSRAEMRMEVVEDYAEALKGGASFPPVVAFYDGQDHWLADGFHRHAAHLMAELPGIAVDVRQGTQQDAIWFSVAANANHGLRRTRADVQRAIERALVHQNAVGKSDREIARHVGCHHETVGASRQRLVSSGEIRQIGGREVTRNGSTYVQSTAGINANRSSLPEADPTADEIEAEHARLDRMIPRLSFEDSVKGMIGAMKVFCEFPEKTAVDWAAAFKEACTLDGEVLQQNVEMIDVIIKSAVSILNGSSAELADFFEEFL